MAGGTAQRTSSNNRTRELIVVDGEVAFADGAGIASWWDTGPPGQPPWRDTMVRLEGVRPERRTQSCLARSRAGSTRLREGFERDAALSRSVDLHSWHARPMPERLLALPGALVERQQ